jgi:hypothetical protein
LILAISHQNVMTATSLKGVTFSYLSWFMMNSWLGNTSSKWSSKCSVVSGSFGFAQFMGQWWRQLQRPFPSAIQSSNFSEERRLWIISKEGDRSSEAVEFRIKTVVYLLSSHIRRQKQSELRHRHLMSAFSWKNWHSR